MEASIDTTDGQEYSPLPILIPCLLCNRKFLPESLVRHKKACEKVLMKKRKQFDSAKQRLAGELAECLPLPPAKMKRVSPARKSSRWKEKHLELLETLRAARVGGPAPLLSKSIDHEQCPHCGRSFGPKAFDRHEEYCREKFARLEHKPSVSTQAKERLEARTKYRAPCVKSKRSITREKYLPANMKREPSPGSNAVNTSNTKSPLAAVVTKAEPKLAPTKQNSLNNTKENDAKAAASTDSHFVRASRNTSSFRASQRRPSKPSPASSKFNMAPPKPQPLAPKPAVNNRPEPPIRQNLQTLPSNLKIKKEIAREESYDPFASAEKQMKELLCFSLKSEKIEPSSFSTPSKPLLLKALPLPYYESFNNSNNKSPAHLDNSHNQSICSMESFLSKSGSQTSLDQSILSIENILDQTNQSLDDSINEMMLLDQNGNDKKTPAVKTTRTKSVDYVTHVQHPSVIKGYVRSKSVASPIDLSLAAVLNFEHLQKSKESLSNKSVALSRESLSNKSVNQSRESLSNKSAVNLSRESLSNKSVSSGSKRSTLNSPDLLERPNSQTKLYSQKSFDNLSDHLDNRSHSPLDTGRKSSQCMRNENITQKTDGNTGKNSSETHATIKCVSPFDEIRNGSAIPAPLDSILARKNSLDEFTAAELLAQLSEKTSQNSSRKSSVCSDCSQVMSRKNSSAGFLPDIARCGVREQPLPRNINLGLSSGEDTQGRVSRSAGGLEPLQRSTSLFEPPVRHPARNKSRGKISCDETTLPKLDDRNLEHRKPMTTLGDLDLVEAELLQSVSEFEKIFDLSSSSSLYSSPYANSTLQGDSILNERKNLNVSKASGDSAYNSLNRKSADEHTSSNSSSGSESSFPHPPLPIPRSNGSKFSKFCHECGTQYPLATAKFCCICGVRRLCVA